MCFLSLVCGDVITCGFFVHNFLLIGKKSYNFRQCLMFLTKCVLHASNKYIENQLKNFCEKSIKSFGKLDFPKGLGNTLNSISRVIYSRRK